MTKYFWFWFSRSLNRTKTPALLLKPWSNRFHNCVQRIVIWLLRFLRNSWLSEFNICLNGWQMEWYSNWRLKHLWAICPIWNLSSLFRIYFLVYILRHHRGPYYYVTENNSLIMSGQYILFILKYKILMNKFLIRDPVTPACILLTTYNSYIWVIGICDVGLNTEPRNHF